MSSFIHSSKKIFRQVKLIFVFSVLAICFSPKKTHGTHMMGADITYECVDTMKFKIIFKVYRDCRGIGMSSVRGTITGCGKSLSISPTRVSIAEKTPLCATAKSRCSPANTYGTGKGIEEHRFELIVDFNKSPYSTFKNCEWIRFSTGQCCRNGAITTGVGGNFYTDALLNLKKAPCNNSPKMTTDPIAFLCCNQPFYYNNGAVDLKDGDSLSFRFSDPLSGTNVAIGYTSPWSKKYPFTPYCPGQPGKVDCDPIPTADPPIGIYLDSLTGDLVLTPTKCDEVTVVVLEMKEYRKNKNGKYEHIGTTRRDMQFWVNSCPGNYPPVLKPLAGKNKFSYTVCAGQQVCFKVSATDKIFVPKGQTSGKSDTVVLTTNLSQSPSPIPGATWKKTNGPPKARYEEYEFCWTPKQGDSRSLPYYFTVTAKDDACPIPAISTRSFSIKVNRRAEADRKITKLACGRVAIESKKDNLFEGSPNYAWSLKDSTGKVLRRTSGYFESTGTPVFSKGRIDTIKFNYEGKYIIEHEINNKFNCPTVYKDTVIIPPVFNVDLSLQNDTFICFGDSLTLIPREANGKAPYLYQWGLPNFTGADTNQSFTVNAPLDGWDTATLYAVDALGCKASDSVNVFLRENPVVDLGPDVRLCTYDDYIIQSQIDTGFWINPFDSVSYNTGDTLIKTWYYNNVQTSDSTDNILATKEGIYILQVSDSTSCFGMDTLEIVMNDTVKAFAGLDEIHCWDEEVKLVANYLDTANNSKSGRVIWRQEPTGTFFSDLDTVEFNIGTKDDPFASKDFFYSLFLEITEDTVSCSDIDTVLFSMDPLPKLTMPNNLSVCFDELDIDLRSQSYTPKDFNNGSWYVEGHPNWINNLEVLVLDSFRDPKNKSCVQAIYRFKDPSSRLKGCENTDSFEICVNPLPRVEAIPGDYCQAVGTINLTTDHILRPANPDFGLVNQWKCLDCKGFDETKILTEQILGGGAQYRHFLSVAPSIMDLGTNDDVTLTLEYTFQDINGCLNKDTVDFTITRLPTIAFDAFPSLCFDDGAISLKNISNSSPSYGEWSCVDQAGYANCNQLGGILNGDTIVTNFDPTFINTKRSFLMRFTASIKGCSISKDTQLVINGLPLINLTSPSASGQTTPFCESDNPIDLTAIPSTGVWSTANGESGLIGNQFDPTQAQIGTTKLIYDFIDGATGCAANDSLYIKIDPQPYANINTIPDTCINADGSAITFTATGNLTNVDQSTWFVVDEDGIQVPFNIVDLDKITFDYTPLNKTTKLYYLIIDYNLGSSVCPVNFFPTDSVTIHPRPELDIIPDDPNGCEPWTVNYSLNIKNEIDPGTSVFDWDFNNGQGSSNLENPSFTFDEIGNNDVGLTVTTIHGCDASFTSQATVYPNPIADFTPDPDNFTTAALPKFTFEDQSTVDGTAGSFIELYSWDFGDPFATDDVSSEQNTLYWYPADTGRYNVSLEVTTNHGCKGAITKEVIIGPDMIIYIPNAFSPNGGGVLDNEDFHVKIKSGTYTSFNIQIFNRWGEIMWTADNPNEGWDGTYKNKPAKQDVYSYLVKVTSLGNEEFTYTGTITLLR